MLDCFGESIFAREARSRECGERETREKQKTSVRNFSECGNGPMRNVAEPWLLALALLPLGCARHASVLWLGCVVIVKC